MLAVPRPRAICDSRYISSIVAIGDDRMPSLPALRTDDRGLRLHDLQAVLLRLVEAVALAHADDDIEAAVMQIERVGTPLAAVAEDGYACSAKCFLVDVFLRIQTHV